jgi:uncharacterized protein YndB with AHSA1/START domain
MDPKGEQTAFVYTTYIQQTPERVWQGLTDPGWCLGWGADAHPGGFAGGGRRLPGMVRDPPVTGTSRVGRLRRSRGSGRACSCGCR